MKVGKCCSPDCTERRTRGLLGRHDCGPCSRGERCDDCAMERGEFARRAGQRRCQFCGQPLDRATAHVSAAQLFAPLVPETARGIARSSVFWHLSEAEQERFRRGWWDSYDKKDARRPRDFAYLAGYRESTSAHTTQYEVNP